ncbi:hypothetical protein OSH11_00960 [Kaistia dalseonensis]|uniref:Uncharacterized protein n=1 Tax=Kaistia dalseonensis TaxID=410840 RepID=A0ABU0H1B4_9HYPH|nr:hypothetical protein [Kaistia dalseonensis]MCX5493265.1 hypothetical protein [Kaistia dalseonensis]MDQ0435822.1 hypothetical protein [Kaistia dalseonensis]
MSTARRLPKAGPTVRVHAIRVVPWPRRTDAARGGSDEAAKAFGARLM